jgi:tetratricopeptide (TPR) repeat protein
MDEPSRRTFTEHPERGGKKDRDVGDAVTRLRAVTSGLYGGVLGGLLGFFMVQRGSPLWVVVVGVAVGWLAVTLATLLMVGSAGSAASTLYTPSAGGTRKKEHSQAESLVARGRYEDAISAFELAIAEDATDPTPYLRIARVYRDHLGRFEDAARWFRRALRDAQLPAGTAFLTRKELVELFTHRMKASERALPELARMAEELAGTPEGEWAATQLREIKARLREDGAG